MARRGLVPRGNYLIYFKEPSLRPRADAAGNRVQAGGARRQAWARFRALRGSEGEDPAGLSTGTVVGVWEVRRAYVRGVSPRWTLEYDGLEYGIVSILPSPRGRGRSHVDVTTARVV